MQYAASLTGGSFDEADMLQNIEACEWLAKALRGLEVPNLDPIYANMRAVCLWTIFLIRSLLFYFFQLKELDLLHYTLWLEKNINSLNHRSKCLGFVQLPEFGLLVLYFLQVREKRAELEKLKATFVRRASEFLRNYFASLVDFMISDKSYFSQVLLL